MPMSQFDIDHGDLNGLIQRSWKICEANAGRQLTEYEYGEMVSAVKNGKPLPVYKNPFFEEDVKDDVKDDSSDASSVSSQDVGPGDDEEWVDSLPAPSADKFSIQYQRYLVTYKTHLNKLFVQKFFEKLAKGKLAAFYVAHEKASSKTDYAHSHVYIDFGKKFQSKNRRIFDLIVGGENIHPNIRYVKHHSMDVRRVLLYISKEDPELSDLRGRLQAEMPALIDRVASAKTTQDLLGLVKRPTDIFGLERIKKLLAQEEADAASVALNFVPYGWQLELLKILEWQGDQRTIHWWYDPVGNNGKTTFIKWLCKRHRKSFHRISDPGPWVNIATPLLIKLQNKLWNGHCVLIDITRRYENKDHLWQVLENLKNGAYTAQKYEGGDADIDCPQVVVLSNFPPRLRDDSGKEYLSLDRFKIRKIENVVDKRPEPKPKRVYDFSRSVGLETDVNDDCAISPEADPSDPPELVSEKIPDMSNQDLAQVYDDIFD